MGPALHRPIAIAVEGGHLAGYWHESHVPSRRGVLILPGFTGDSVGPARLFVEFAAAAAAVGWHALRIDFRGRGISPGDVAATDLDSMERDARAALAVFQREARLECVVLAGLCLGSVVALSLPSSASVDGFVFWSPEPVAVPDSWARRARRLSHQLRTYAKKAATPEPWRRLFRAELRGAGVGRVLVRAVVPKAGNTAAPMTRGRLAAVRAELREHADLPMLCVLAREDPEAASAAESYACRAHELRRIVWIDGADHNFLALRGREELIRESVGFLRVLPARAGAARALAGV